jgi:tRNA-specific 2-thiouridylase
LPRATGKDQSYFLFGLGPAQLERAHFPLGELSKDEVRGRARSLGLATAEKPESQELCFVPDGDTGAAVEKLRPGRAPGEGEIVDERGRVVGRHPGVHRYTIGQRRGLGGGAAGARYVKALDAAKNRVVVTDARGLEARAGRVARVSWIAGAAPGEAFEARVRIRYRHEGADAQVTPQPDGGATLAFAEPVRALAPGQAAVFYRGDQVLGGGPLASAAP